MRRVDPADALPPPVVRVGGRDQNRGCRRIEPFAFVQPPRPDGASSRKVHPRAQFVYMGASHCTHDDHVVPAITVNWPTIFLNVLGGLVLFLFGVFQLATAIEPLASDRARGLLGRFTTNRLAAVLTGAVATTLLDSSSVTIILVIALVNGGLVTFPPSLGVIMGSNIGTTVSSQIFALDVEQYAPLVTDSRKPANSSHRLAHVLQSEEHQAET